MSSPLPAESVVHDSWYKYGVMFLFFEMAVAVAVCGYSLYLTFHGLGGFPGKH
jgi:hypothetical protein